MWGSQSPHKICAADSIIGLKSMIVIIDYGMGNLRSVLNKLERIDAEAIISSKSDDIKSADKIILPGVGHFAQAMKNLKKYDMISILNEKALEHKIPILGICLGAQLITSHSEEGDTEGLGWVHAETKKFDFSNLSGHLKVPHIGWNTIDMQKKTVLFEGVNKNDMFYFVHSYYISCNDENDVIGYTKYGHRFASSIQKGNIYGTQFHPEKSHRCGMQILQNFTRRV